MHNPSDYPDGNIFMDFFKLFIGFVGLVFFVNYILM